MDFANRTILILGGSGLVGHAIARRLLDFGPKKIVLVALFEDELTAAARALDPHRGKTEIAIDWGNVFMPAPAARLDRHQILADAKMRALVIGDLLDDLTPEILKRSHLYQLIAKHRPDAIVDCINTATAFAYQDVFHSARELLDVAHERPVDRALIEEHVLTLTIPQLIRHVQIMTETLRTLEVQGYVKIGTSGTGGMGLNIPFTHSEEWPSRTLLTKSAVAGAQSLLLFLMARTPGLPATVEIKPSAAIGWRRIVRGPIRRHGKPIPRVDCPEPLAAAQAFAEGAAGWKDLGRPLESVYIDVGENGLFARGEFEALTALGSMELITPEEVADYAIWELQGRPTGRDIVAALDGAVAGPTFRAGILRAYAVQRLRELEAEHGVDSVAFEMLGPHLTKRLFEAAICARVAPTVRALSTAKGKTLAADAAKLIASDAELRSEIISVGIPILVDGGRLYRGAEVMITPRNGDLDDAARRGWVDLREPNMAQWIARAERIVAQGTERAAREDSSSAEDWEGMDPDGPVEAARFAVWVFKHEDGGERLKR
ncbi:MAG TPA: hypothetical protein VJ992_05270 [Gemmatimonadales bacterium]|nr:hypothetical protein [Gemmatimonadales bacterium]